MQLRSKSKILKTINPPTNGPLVVLKRLTDTQIQQFTKRSSIISNNRPKRIRKLPKRYIHFANPIGNNSVISSTTKETSYELMKIDEHNEGNNCCLPDLSNPENHLNSRLVEDKSNTSLAEDPYVYPECVSLNKTNCLQEGPWVVLERLLESQEEFPTKTFSVISRNKQEKMNRISRRYNCANPTISNRNSITTQQIVTQEDYQQPPELKEGPKTKVCTLTASSNPVDSLEDSRTNFYVTATTSIPGPSADVECSTQSASHPRQYKSFVNPIINRAVVSSTRTDEAGSHKNSQKYVSFITSSSEEDLAAPVMLAAPFTPESHSGRIDRTSTSDSSLYEDSVNFDGMSSDIEFPNFEDSIDQSINEIHEENPQIDIDSEFDSSGVESSSSNPSPLIWYQDTNDGVSENPRVDDVIEPSQIQPPPNREQSRQPTGTNGNQQQDGERGYLEGLASRYADLFSTHYVDVLGHLEDLRRIEWTETSPKERKVTTPVTPPGTYSPTGRGSPLSGALTTSMSQPLYVPGKYSPSSCLSDKEEDEIYGFGYGVFASQIARQQQQRLVGQQQNQQTATSHQPLLVQQHHNYQTCLSPRSAYFYEFPPNEQNYTNTSKKRTTFSRFLRGLKTSHRKEKHGGSSPRHGRAAAAARGVPQRVDTPDSVLQSGLGLTDLGQHAVLRSMVDPRDYDRLRNLQLNGGTPNTFEETIYRLKLQEAMKKREKFTKEHEEILRDIKQGLLQLGKEGIRGPLSGDDTYMYDEEVRMLAPVPHYADPLNRPAHWYDEPPYESDPEDFLMGCSEGPSATIQNGRVCFTLNTRQDSRGEGVISLRSAGDISLPRESQAGLGIAPRRGLILPSQAGYPPAIIPLRSSRDIESGDYAGSDVQSVSSRLSTLSVDTSRSEHHELGQIISPQYYTQLEGKIRHFRKISGYSRSEDGMSPSQSSDYEDQEDFSNCSQQIATVHVSSDGRSAGVSGLVGKVRGLREDVQRKISRLKNDNVDQQRIPDQSFQCSASSVESLPSGSGSSTQALVRAGSNHSSISNEEPDPSPTDQIVGRARALVDHTPSPYDTEALKFKAGDIIDIVSMNPSGQWRGICRGKKGTFKFINVELLSERSVKSKRDIKWHRNIKGKPVSVEDLLKKIGLHDYISVFILNGYEDLELFKELEPSDLDYLGIVNTDHRAKLLTAVQLLHEMDSGSEGDIAGSSSECDEHRGLTRDTENSPFGRRQFPRDSGCYDASVKSTRQVQQHISPQGESDTSDSAGFSDNRNNLDSVVEQCNNEIMARVKQAQKNLINLKEELSYQPNIPNSASIELQLLQQKKPKDSYVSVHGQTSLIDPCRKTTACAARSMSGTARKNLEETEEPKLPMEKYAQSGTSNSDVGLESGNVNVLGRSCLSEKSSDSGVSSSSLSSSNTKETPRPVLNMIDNSTAQANFKKT